MQLVIRAGGVVQCLYDEQLALGALGSLTIRRASHVEPTGDGHWSVDLAPVGGPVLGPFDLRSQALEVERRWLEEHWLAPASRRPAPLPALSP